MIIADEGNPDSISKEEYQKIIEELANNPKIKKAMKGLLSPLQQEGDSLTISFKQASQEQETKWIK